MSEHNRKGRKRPVRMEEPPFALWGWLYITDWIIPSKLLSLWISVSILFELLTSNSMSGKWIGIWDKIILTPVITLTVNRQRILLLANIFRLQYMFYFPSLKMIHFHNPRQLFQSIPRSTTFNQEFFFCFQCKWLHWSKWTHWRIANYFCVSISRGINWQVKVNGFEKTSWRARSILALVDFTRSLHGVYETYRFFRHETAIAEMFLLQNVLLVKIILVCRVCLTEQLKGGKRNTAKTIDSLEGTKLIAIQLVWEQESQRGS